jgi:hypothetical protein
MDVFNEEKLHQEIASVWGEHGAHAEVYRDVLAQRDLLISENAQFARLLCDLRAVHLLVIGEPREDLFERASVVWERAKSELWEAAEESHTTSDGYTFKKIDGKWTDWDMTFDSIEQMEDGDGITATEDPVQQEQQS